jgi:beta-mannosidase
MTSYVMEHHQRNAAGNGKIVTYLTDHFQLPTNFPALVYLTQVLQAEAMRVGIEHWRRDPACSGTLYWQLNDCWPVASWAGIDYFGRWKALHYATRRCYAPVLLSIEDQGTRMGLFVTNDTVDPWHGELRWSLETLRGGRLDAGQAPVNVAGLATARVQALDFAAQVTEANRREVLLVCELWHAGERLALSIAPFAPSKHVRLEDPLIDPAAYQIGRSLLVELRGQSLARFVEVALEGADVVWSDNYFDLPAGRSIGVTCALPEGWTLERAQAALRVRSLVDSY